MTRAFLARTILIVLAGLAGSQAQASLFRVYSEGPATLTQDGLGLFGAPSNTEDYLRTGLTRLTFEFEFPADGSGPFIPVGTGTVNMSIFGRQFTATMESATLEPYYTPNALDQLYGTLEVAPGLAGRFGFSFGPGPYGSGNTYKPMGVGYIKVWEPGTDLVSHLYMFQSDRASTREIPDQSDLPEPATAWLILAACGIACVARRRRDASAD